MADDVNTNPFLSDDEDDFTINDVENVVQKSIQAIESQDLNWDSIAARLLKDKFTLTALELHTELVEAGRELPRLRDFFSNPGNFERTKEDSPPTTLPRTSSIQTFDSLDFARYSDDGERQVDERVAVLEFELRKAQDTIKSLRASLTREAELVIENEHSKQEKAEEGRTGFSDETIKTMEKKALNFLVNQYLLQINNKLTAVTFSEENEDQDFEDWDDVGLNIPQPPDLLHLYRDYYNRVVPAFDNNDTEIQTDMTAEYITRMEEDMIQMRSVLNEKEAKISELEELLLNKDKEMLRRRGVAEGSESEPLPSPFSENQSNLFDDIPFTQYASENQTDAGEESDLPLCQCDDDENETGEVGVRVQSPEVYRLDFTDEGDHSGDQDMLDNHSVDGHAEKQDRNNRNRKTSDKSENDESVVQDSSVSDTVVSNSNVDVGDGKDSNCDQSDFSTNQNGEKTSGNDSNVSETVNKERTKEDGSHGKMAKQNGKNRSRSPTPVKMGTNELKESGQTTSTDKRQQAFVSKPDKQLASRKMSSAFSKALRDVCFHVPKDNRIIMEVSKITDADQQKVVAMLGRCLPHIVPNVLLAKREELIPLIICTSMLHPEARERDNLLNILFNLIKKPDEEQRQLILTGCVAFAQHVGPTRLEAELLPQCWEQISHKYMERRLLVAEACGALAAYLPPEIRSSLVLSMLQQMLQDDKEADVREAVVRSLGLIIGFLSDKDKYPQGSDLLKTALRDSSEKVVNSAKQIFLPSFAMWAYELGKLEHSLLHTLLRDLEELVKDAPHNSASASAQRSPGGLAPINEGRFLLYVTTLTELVPFLYVSVLESGPYTDKLDETQILTEDMDSIRFPKSSSSLTDLVTIVGNQKHLVMLLKLFEKHINQEWFEPWDNLNWVVNNLIPRLLEVVMGSALQFPRIVSSLAKCFYRLSTTFGKTFVDKKIKPRFIDVLLMDDEHLDPSNTFTSNSTPLTTCVVPVYASGVLSAFNTDEDRLQLSQFLREALFCLSIYKSPKDSLRIALAELCSTSENHELLVNVLWEGVVHSAPLVRATAARMFDILLRSVSEFLASTRIVPALVTLGSDPEIAVRMATIPALGTIVETIAAREILEKVYMQLQTFLDDPMYREEHDLHMELVAMFAKIGPNAEQKFRDEFVLPRLTAITLETNNLQNDSKKKEMALLLFEAYSALSCCFINYQLVQEAMLPGLRCLKQEMSQIAPEHEEVINSMIKEYESKVETSRPADRSSSFTGNFAATGDDMKARMMNRLKESTSKASNISSLFNRKK